MVSKFDKNCIESYPDERKMTHEQDILQSVQAAITLSRLFQTDDTTAYDDEFALISVSESIDSTLDGEDELFKGATHEESSLSRHLGHREDGLNCSIDSSKADCASSQKEKDFSGEPASESSDASFQYSEEGFVGASSVGQSDVASTQKDMNGSDNISGSEPSVAFQNDQDDITDEVSISDSSCVHVPCLAPAENDSFDDFSVSEMGGSSTQQDFDGMSFGNASLLEASKFDEVSICKTGDTSLLYQKYDLDDVSITSESRDAALPPEAEQFDEVVTSDSCDVSVQTKDAESDSVSVCETGDTSLLYQKYQLDDVSTSDEHTGPSLRQNESDYDGASMSESFDASLKMSKTFDEDVFGASISKSSYEYVGYLSRSQIEGFDLSTIGETDDDATLLSQDDEIDGVSTVKRDGYSLRYETDDGFDGDVSSYGESSVESSLQYVPNPHERAQKSSTEMQNLMQWLEHQLDPTDSEDNDFSSGTDNESYYTSALPGGKYGPSETEGSELFSETEDSESYTSCSIQQTRHLEKSNDRPVANLWQQKRIIPSVYGLVLYNDEIKGVPPSDVLVEKQKLHSITTWSTDSSSLHSGELKDTLHVDNYPEDDDVVKPFVIDDVSDDESVAASLAAFSRCDASSKSPSKQSKAEVTRDPKTQAAAEKQKSSAAQQTRNRQQRRRHRLRELVALMTCRRKKQENIDGNTTSSSVAVPNVDSTLNDDSICA